MFLPTLLWGVAGCGSDSPTDGGPLVDPIVLRFCEGIGAPFWLAVQDGEGAWRRVEERAEGEFAFEIESERMGVAWLTFNGPVSRPNIDVAFLATAEVETYFDELCRFEGPIFEVSITAQGLGEDFIALVSMGIGSLALSSQASAGDIPGVDGGSRTLVAGLHGPESLQGPVDRTLERVVVRKGLAPEPDLVLSDLDFEAEGLAPADASVTLPNRGPEEATLQVDLLPASGEVLPFYFFRSFDMEVPFGAIPSVLLDPGDLQRISFQEFLFGGSTRSATRVFAEADDFTLEMGPAVSGFDIDFFVAPGYLRPSVAYEPPEGYGRFWEMEYVDRLPGNAERRGLVVMSEGYAAGGPLNLGLPDFSEVDRWDPEWAPREAPFITVTLSVFGWSEGGGVGVPSNFAGAELRSGSISRSFLF